MRGVGVCDGLPVLALMKCQLLSVSSPIGFQKVEQGRRYLVVLNVASAQFVGDVHSHVATRARHGVDRARRATRKPLGGGRHQLCPSTIFLDKSFKGFGPRFIGRKSRLGVCRCSRSA